VVTAIKDLPCSGIKERDRAVIENASEILGDMKSNWSCRSGKQNGSAEFVEPFGLLLAAFGFQGLFPGTIRKMTRDEGGGEKGEKGNPIFGIRDGEAADRREKKKPKQTMAVTDPTTASISPQAAAIRRMPRR
jgi:hypothetical protein